ncbi:MAG: hypothetical protein FWH29_10720 [Methanobrevibacter sp.]|nr:hypothetical protein [Methanobrevibacter sp.]
MNNQYFPWNNYNYFNDSEDNSNINRKNPKKVTDLITEENINIIPGNLVNYQYGFDVLSHNHVESKDFSQEINQKGFNRKNIDFEDLKEKLSKIYFDEKLVINTINHIRKTLNSHVEIQWETKGMKTKIGVKTIGDINKVGYSNSLILKAANGEKTLYIIHNHTSGTPLPHPEDIVNMLNHKIVNSGISGNYGFLNMKNSFKKLSKKDISNLRIKADEIFIKLEKNAFKNNPYIKYELPNVRSSVKYKYYKENIIDIINEYNIEFQKYGIEFKYTPYKLRKR